MPVILVVDDSKVDQRLIGHLIEKEDIDWIVEFANSAEEALVRLQGLAVDILVTDMRMPGMDGLALLQIVRSRYKDIPVVVVTGEGSEELAAEALHQGAASYVPKAELVVRLNETIKQVLDVNLSRRSYDSLMDSVETVRFQLDLGNRLELSAALVSSVQQILAGLNICNLESQRRVGVALDEAILHAICHGNLEFSAEEAIGVRNHLRDGTTSPLLNERRELPNFKNRAAKVEMECTPELVRLTVRHSGAECDVSDIECASTAESLENNLRRGFVLMKTLMDRIEFADSGRSVTMIKYRESDQPSQDVLIPME